MEPDKPKWRRFFPRWKNDVKNMDYGAEFDDMFDWGLSNFNFPEVDIREVGEDLIVYFDMPGLNKEDIKLSIKEDKIEVKAYKRQEMEKDEDYYVCERSYKGFYRVIKLPIEIMPEKARAKYEDGVLIIIAPKSDIERSSMEIE